MVFVTATLCLVLVLVVPSGGDLLSGLQLVTDVSNSLVPKLFQVSYYTHRDPLITSWMPVLRYGEYVFIKLNEIIVFFVSLA